MACLLPRIEELTFLLTDSFREQPGRYSRSEMFLIKRFAFREIHAGRWCVNIGWGPLLGGSPWDSAPMETKLIADPLAASMGDPDMPPWFIAVGSIHSRLLDTSSPDWN